MPGQPKSDGFFKDPPPRFLPVYRPGMYRRRCRICSPYACNTMRHPIMDPRRKPKKRLDKPRTV